MFVILHPYNVVHRQRRVRRALSEQMSIPLAVNRRPDPLTGVEQGEAMQAVGRLKVESAPVVQLLKPLHEESSAGFNWELAPLQQGG